MNKAVVLLSGGMDSIVAAALAKAKGRRLFALSLYYGQKHQREIQAARWQARRLGAETQVVLRLPLDAVAQGSLLLGSKKNPAPGKPKGSIPPTYVSFRNGVFLSLAFSYAEALGAQEIWGGWCRTDHRGYPDCRPSFFRAMERAAWLGTKAGSQEGQKIKIVAPLAGLSKAKTIALGSKLGLQFEHTWTCYQGKARPCGRCDACRLRAEGFKEAGVEDPLG